MDVEEQCCDAVFMLTVLEHLDHPYNLLNLDSRKRDEVKLSTA